MDFLNKAFAQFNDLFRSMTPGGRITAGLLLVVAVVSVGYLFQHQAGGGDDDLFGGAPMQPSTLDKMEAAFGKAGLSGYSIAGGRVKVPHAQRAAYWGALADAKALPPNFIDSFKDDSSIFDSPMQRQVRLDQAKEARLSLVISNMKGIAQASVIIDKEGQSGLNPTPLKTASVTVWGTGGTPPDDDLVDKIRYCVATANAGMKPENVTICDGDGMVYRGSEANGGPDGEYARAARKAEQVLNDKVRNALRYIPNVIVTSAVTLDHDKGSHSLEIKNDPKPVPERTTENNHMISRETGSSGGGAPGLQAQGGGPMAAASLAGGGKGNETNEENKNETINAISRTSTEKETYGGIPQKETVSVIIPTSYFERVWQAANPAKEGEEAKKPDQAALDKIGEEIMLKVRSAVAPLLSAAPDVKDPTLLVTVTSFQDIKTAEIPGPAVTQRALTWFGENWPMLAMVGLVLFSLGMLRSMLRGVPGGHPHGGSPESAALSMRVTASESKSPEAEEPVEAAAARRLRRMSGTGPSLRDELSEMVKEDPDSAANVLRSWIGQVT